MARTKSGTRDLKEACLEEALSIIAQSGLEGLSLREVARRLGVSHQAPYRHFPSRDHLLAEVVSRAYVAFAAHLDARPRGADPFADLSAMGEAYLAYASAHPLEYRLMFGTPLPDPAEHPDMMENGRHAFSILQAGIARLERPPQAQAPAELDALYVWATVHGLASIRQCMAANSLGLPEQALDAMHHHVMHRLGTALMSPVAPADPPAPPAKDAP